MEKLGVVVKGVSSGKDEEVSGEVTCEEEDEDEAGDCDDEFTTDRGVKDGTEGAAFFAHG